MYDEWELLVITDDIEQGDYIDVEDCESEVFKMIYVKENSKHVILKDENGALCRFSKSTLDEVGEPYRRILEKSQNVG